MKTKVVLGTSDGRIVAKAETMPFKPMPEVLVWGDRVFKHYEEVNGVCFYRECFYTVVISAERVAP